MIVTDDEADANAILMTADEGAVARGRLLKLLQAFQGAVAETIDFRVHVQDD